MYFFREETEYEFDSKKKKQHFLKNFINYRHSFQIISIFTINDYNGNVSVNSQITKQLKKTIETGS